MLQKEAKTMALPVCEQVEVAFSGQAMSPWGPLQAAEEGRAGHGTLIKAETQRMGVSGGCREGSAKAISV